MSRVAKNPISIPGGMTVDINGGVLKIKGNKGECSHTVHPLVKVVLEDGRLHVSADEGSAKALAGTTRAILNNIVVGMSKGFEKKLEISGVGYRAATKGNTLVLSLGFSHPVEFEAPDGITITTPSQTEIVVSGTDKQQVGEVAACIRAYRPPEPYKGKGVRYADEHILRKEPKKA